LFGNEKDGKMKKTIIGKPLTQIPWQEKPKNCRDIIWRYDKNPVIGRNALKEGDRIFNSALVPYKDGL
jgi:beta-1,4-mannooligosaccharide/beta-1,4-mannosyl-N-acetylglucosamine phosphorylase